MPATDQISSLDTSPAGDIQDVTADSGRITMKALALLVLLLFASVTWAQEQPGVNCVPIQGQGWEGCAPIGNSQQQVPTSPDHWGAIASDSNTGALGTASNNTLGKGMAQLIAIAICQSKGGTKCKLDVTYHNKCAAIVVGQAAHITTTAETLNKAVDKAMKKCNSTDDSSCHVYYSDCSRPGWIK
ncbi:DUF4189 domain-containing protein [Rhodanobacter sp. Col0626]|uniref:DUF4189 domain-containing protein n=1 Tax=Rhodanobacter sp. Col0626 TaxID=3415679 RepID=UPI003CFB935F